MNKELSRPDIFLKEDGGVCEGCHKKKPDVRFEGEAEAYLCDSCVSELRQHKKDNTKKSTRPGRYITQPQNQPKEEDENERTCVECGRKFNQGSMAQGNRDYCDDCNKTSKAKGQEQIKPYIANPCPECGGKGKRDSGVGCPVCNGSGKVEKAQGQDPAYDYTNRDELEGSDTKEERVPKDNEEDKSMMKATHFVCDECGKECSSQAELWEHMKEHANKGYEKCANCLSEAYEIKSEANWGNREKNYQCMKCGFRFSKQIQNNQLIKGKHYCKHCGKKNADYQGNGTFKCNSCETIFN